MGTLRRLPRLLLPMLLLTAGPTTAALPTGAPAPTTQAATRPVAERVAELIPRLNADDFKDRQGAQEQLAGLGDDALPALRAARESAKDPETRGRLDAAVRVVERESVNVATRVSLRLHDANPKEGFDALGQQSGFTMPIWPPNLWSQNGPAPKATATVDLNDVTYWTAMRALAAKADVHVQTMGGFGGRPSIMQGNSEWASVPAVEVGPFLIVITDMSRHHVANLTKGNGVQRDLHASVVVLPEPKVRVIQFDQQLTVDAIEDETGASVLPDGQRQIAAPAQLPPPSPYFQYPYAYTVQLDAWRSPIGKRIATFKGSTRLRIQSRGGKIVFDDALAAKNVTQTVEGHRVVLQSCAAQGGNYQAELTIYRDALSESQWQQFQHSVRDLRLITASGGVYRMNGGGGGGSDKELHWSAFLTNDESPFGGGGGRPPPERKAGEAVKLVVPFPLEVKDVTVPFEFHDLPIP